MGVTVARRRSDPEPLPGDGIPPELAAGPDVTRWAPREYLAAVQATRGTPQATQAVKGAMLAARRLWRDAVEAWGRDQGLDHLSTWRRIPARRPYWP